jgi:hypothetical protein
MNGSISTEGTHTAVRERDLQNHGTIGKILAVEIVKSGE